MLASEAVLAEQGSKQSRPKSSASAPKQASAIRAQCGADTQSRFLADKANDVFQRGRLRYGDCARTRSASRREARHQAAATCRRPSRCSIAPSMALREQNTFPVRGTPDTRSIRGRHRSPDGRRVLRVRRRQTSACSHAETGSRDQADRRGAGRDRLVPRSAATARWLVTTARDKPGARLSGGRLESLIARACRCSCRNSRTSWTSPSLPTVAMSLRRADRGRLTLWDADRRHAGSDAARQPACHVRRILAGRTVARHDPDEQQMRVWKIGGRTPHRSSSDRSRRSAATSRTPDSFRTAGVLLVSTRNGLAPGLGCGASAKPNDHRCREAAGLDSVSHLARRQTA